MWDCENCGTLQIAASIEACPVCHEPRPSQNVAEEPNTAPAPDGEGEPDSDGPFPADEADEAPPSPQDEVEEEDDGPDHD